MPSTAPVAPESAALTAEDSSTGNLNYCFVVKDGARKTSVFVKQAPDFVKCLGEDAKLTTERIRFEAQAALEFMKHAPGTVPDLYYFDATNCVMVMEHLSDYRLLNDDLIAEVVSTAAARSVAVFMGKVHTATHTELLTPETCQDYQKRFHNPALCGITDTYIFTLPFIEDESNSHTTGLDERVAAIRANSAFLDDVKAVHRIFQTKKEALLHGDLHAGSIMTNGLDSRVIDHEFVFYGPAGFDLGLFTAGYIFPFAAASAKGKASTCSAILVALEDAITHYLSLLKAASLSDSAVAEIFKDSLGFTGCELMRRVLGVAKRKDLEGIEDIPTKLQAENTVLTVGETFIRACLGREAVSSVEEMLACISKAAET